MYRFLLVAKNGSLEWHDGQRPCGLVAPGCTPTWKGVSSSLSGDDIGSLCFIYIVTELIGRETSIDMHFCGLGRQARGLGLHRNPLHAGLGIFAGWAAKPTG
nr:hypothetical protein Iba_chr08eCG2650 [Ipomoea batatas]